MQSEHPCQQIDWPLLRSGCRPSAGSPPSANSPPSHFPLSLNRSKLLKAAPSLLPRMSRKRTDSNHLLRTCFFMNLVSKCAAEVAETDFHHIGVLQRDTFAKRKRIRSEEVNVNRAGLAMSCKFEVMVLDIRETVAHVGFPTGNRFGPERHTIPEDPH